MTLKEFKTALKGRKLYAWVLMFGENGEYVPVSKGKFLNAIGADVPYNCDGLADGTHIDASIIEDRVHVG